jgi:hypothetical protein
MIGYLERATIRQIFPIDKQVQAVRHRTVRLFRYGAATAGAAKIAIHVLDIDRSRHQAMRRFRIGLDKTPDHFGHGRSAPHIILKLGIGHLTYHRHLAINLFPVLVIAFPVAYEPVSVDSPGDHVTTELYADSDIFTTVQTIIITHFASPIPNTDDKYFKYSLSVHIAFPGESDIFATGCPLHFVILITI